jgi:hypothetical protein
MEAWGDAQVSLSMPAGHGHAPQQSFLLQTSHLHHLITGKGHANHQQKALFNGHAPQQSFLLLASFTLAPL